MIEQLAWDFTELDEKPAHTGSAPFHFTMEYFTVDEFAAAKAASALVCGDWPFTGGHRRMWGKSFVNPAFTGGRHGLMILSADLQCDCKFKRGENDPCSCVGDLMSNAICDPCAWHSVGTEDSAVEAWHDHAWPGWRDLPVIPVGVRPGAGGINKSTKGALAWVVANYPPEWQVPGAPMVTQRDGSGRRHVPGYSPWGGYDLSARRRSEFHMLTLVTPASGDKFATADCACGIRIPRPKHDAAQRALLEHIERETVL